MSNLKEMCRVVDNTKPRQNKENDPEEKDYLICITGNDTDLWCIVKGRTEAREFIKNNIDIINFEESFILVETLPLNQRKSIHAFMKHCEQFFNDGFDIDEYVKGDFNEIEWQSDNDINQDLYVPSSEKLDMASIMDGYIKTSSLE